MWLLGKRGQRASRAQRAGRRYAHRFDRVSRGRGFVEQLEDRRPLAITPVFAAGVLTFTGDGANDTLVITSNNATSSDVDFSGTGIVGTVNQAGVTQVVIDLDGGTDAVVLNGSAAADTIALNALAINYGGTLYSLAGVEDLSIDGQGDADTISATGVTVPGVLAISGGVGTDALSITGPLTTGSLSVSDVSSDDVELAGLITTSGNQQYNVPVTLTANTTVEAGAGNITFASTVSGAAFTLNANSTGATTFGGAVNVAALTTNLGGTTAINGDVVTTSGDQTYNDAVTLNSAVNFTTLTSTAGSVRFIDTLDSLLANEEILTVNANVDAEFNGAIGSAAVGALSSLDANAAGNVRIAAARIINTADLEAATGQIVDLNGAANNITANSLVATAANGINLDTAINNLLASNTTAGDIEITEVDDLTVLLVSAPGQIVTLTAGGAILDGNLALNNITTTSLIVGAVNGISLDTTIVNLLANNSLANGIDINELDDLTVSTVTAPLQTVTLTAGGDIFDGNVLMNNVTAGSLVAIAVSGISLDTTIDNLVANNTTSDGIDISEVDNLTVSTVLALNQTVTLTAGGLLTNVNGAVVDVTAGSRVATAGTGILLDTLITNLTATITGVGNIDIDEGDDLAVITASAPGQIVTLLAGGAISDGNGAPSNVLAGTLIATATNGINLDTTIGSISASNATANGIDINETDDLEVLGISAPGQAVILTAGGMITDGNGLAPNVIAASLTANAVTGITLGTTVANLTATNTTSGGIAITETDDLNILLVSAPGQTASIVAGGDLNVNSVIAGTAILNAGDAIIDVNGGVVDVTATSLDATAVNGITLDTTIQNLTALNTGAGGIDINESDNLNVITASALAQAITLAAGGAITDGNGPAPNVLSNAFTVSAMTGITLGTTITSLTATNTTSGGISITETDDLNILNVVAPAQAASITAAGDLNVNTMSAGQVLLNAGDVIADPNGAVVNVTADSLNATAVNGITLDTAIGSLSASNSIANGIDIDELDNVTVNGVSAPNQTVLLSAGGTIGDGNGPAPNVLATTLTVDAVNGITLGTTIVNLTATNTTSGGIAITETDDLNILLASALGQTASISAAGDLHVTTVNAGTATLSAGDLIDNVNAGVDVTATSLNATAVNGITLDTTIASLNATNSTAGGIVINETDNLNVVLASALNQAVNLQAGGSQNVTIVNAATATLIAAGAITDANGVAVNVSGGALNALANNGIALGTAIDNLTATNNTSGDILINESSGLNVLSAINGAAAIQIVCASGLLNITTVDAKGHFLGSTDDSAAPGDDVVVSGVVKADNAVSLVAGDNSTLQATSNIKSINSFVYLKVGGTSGDGAGGQLLTYAAVQGNAALQYPIVAEGGTGNDLFSIQNLPLSPIAILARGGNLDNTFITFSQSSDKINAFATLVDVAESGGAAKPGVEVTYVDNEQLFFNTAGGDDNVFVQMPEPVQGVLANIIRMSTGAGDDSLKINGSTQSEAIRVADFTADGNYRFQVNGVTGETEALQVFGFTGNDIIENAASIAALLDGGNGQDQITGSNVAVHGVTKQAIYDVIFGGGDFDTIFGNDGNDFIFADHDFNSGAPVQTIANGDVINSGRGFDVIVALGGDSVRRAGGDFDPDLIVGQNVALSINDFLFAQLLPPSANNVAAQLQAALGTKAAKPIP